MTVMQWLRQSEFSRNAIVDNFDNASVEFEGDAWKNTIGLTTGHGTILYTFKPAAKGCGWQVALVEHVDRLELSRIG